MIPILKQFLQKQCYKSNNIFLMYISKNNVTFSNEDNQIKFYRPNHKNGFLSNFYPSPFMVNKIKFQTNEHYFQSQKYNKFQERNQVIQAKTPALAFKLGRSKSFTRRQNWEQIKEQIMYQGLRHKFTTHKDLKQKLLQTNNSKLIEHTPRDHYWADGGDGSGKNRLGFLLMKLRTELKKQLVKNKE